MEAFLVAILDQLQHMRADFGSYLDYLSNEMCKMNTRIGHIARCQSCLGGFAHFSSLDPSESSNGESDDASGSDYDDEMIGSQ